MLNTGAVYEYIYIFVVKRFSTGAVWVVWEPTNNGWEPFEPHFTLLEQPSYKLQF